MEPHRAEEVLLFHWLLKPVTLHNLPDGHTRSLVEWCGPIQRGPTVAEELRGGLKRCLRQKAMGVLATVGFSRKFIDGSSDFSIVSVTFRPPRSIAIEVIQQVKCQ